MCLYIYWYRLLSLMLRIFSFIFTIILIKAQREKQRLACTKWTKWVINAKIYVLFYSDFSTFCDVTYRDIVHHITCEMAEPSNGLQTGHCRCILQLKSYFLSKGKTMHDCYCYMYVIELYMIWGLLNRSWSGNTIKWHANLILTVM